jgi:hypothetical protein
MHTLRRLTRVERIKTVRADQLHYKFNSTFDGARTHGHAIKSRALCQLTEGG